jgi:glycosyltransferase involved in cell wall biosynthesis
MFSVSVCAPAYNEEAGINHIIKSWLKSLELAIQDRVITDYEIIVCDDGSTDKTIEIIAGLDNKKIKIVRNSKNEGPGIAIRNAIKESSMQFVITIDSDGQFNLGEALNWIPGAESDTFFLGYRKKKDKKLFRFGSAVSTKLFRRALGGEISDANCMLKLMPGSIVRTFDLRAVGLNYSGEMTFLICTTQSNVKWRPVTHSNRIAGISSAKFLRDGFKRVIFQLFLLFENQLVQKKIISRTIIFKRLNKIKLKKAKTSTA